jgi:uncharacterized protein (TIGR00251 family)
MVISVRVHPRASRPRASWNDGVLEVWVNAPPAEGAANKAVLAAVARHFDVPKSMVRLRSGAGSRTKLIEVDQGERGAQAERRGGATSSSLDDLV